MSRFSLSVRRTAFRLTGAAVLGALAGCADTSDLTRATSPTSPSAIIIIGGHPAVLNAQLRAIGNPDEKPLSAVVGQIQLRISESEAGLVLDWQAHFANPECEASTAFGGGAIMVQDSEDTPSPEDVAVLRLLAPGTPLGCGDNFLEGSSSISEELVELLFSDPEEFVAAFFIIDGGVLAGTLQVAGAPDLETR